MIFKRTQLTQWIGRAIALSGLLLGMSGFSAESGGINVEAKLIWGTDNVGTNTNLREVDGKLAKTLHKMPFKWKNYYEITNCSTKIARDAIGSLQLSPRCTLKVKNVGASAIELDCIGDGKKVCKGHHNLPAGKLLTFGGNGDDGTGWFIVLHSLDEDGK